MTLLLMRVLRYELSLSIGALLSIIVIVTVLAAVWPAAPSWIGFPAGFAIAVTEKRWLRRKAAS